MNERFRKFALKISTMVGHPTTFFLAVIAIIIWGLTGRLFDYSNTWQLVINTGTTIITFLMVFIIQNTQNRDARSMQLKLDELIESIGSASDKFINLEDLSDAELDKLHAKFQVMRDEIEKHKQARRVK